ncbi:MAG: DUF3108 domain-containing protein, partial [Bacteroidota bacterium]|nr:DUF3108 domain-containing protein [Bacteroidota bacterium]
MKKIITALLLLFMAIPVMGQSSRPAFKPGEWLKFRIHYGFLNASYATLHLTSETLGNTPVYHVVGRGKTTGFASIFFKVDDTYESYFGKEHGRPYKFVRKIDEGGYTKDIEIEFDYKEDKALLIDNKNGTKQDIAIHDEIQDLISASYYLRSNYNLDEFKIGDSIDLDMLFDDDGVFKFQLKYLGK